MIYHIAEPDAWERALELGEYRHPSLAAEGFIHCSTREQLDATATRYYADRAELLVLAIVDRRIKDQVKWELAPSVGDEFPHIYGAMPLEAVEDVSIVARTDAGAWDWSDLHQGL